MILARATLLFWLSFAVDNQDDLYGVRYSMKLISECKRIVEKEDE